MQEMPANALLGKGTEEVRDEKSNWRSSFECTSRNIFSHIIEVRSTVRFALYLGLENASVLK